MVSGTLSLPSSGCFSPFPHGTGTLSVSREYLALPDGPGGFTQGFSCPALLRMPMPCGTLRVRSRHPLRRDFPDASTRFPAWARLGPTTPGMHLRTSPGLGCSPVARHYWGNHCCFLFLEVLRCFSSLRSPPRHIDGDDRPPGGRVFPFGDPRVKGHLHLTADYRSLSRPSSPP